MLADILWGKKSKVAYLMFASLLLLFAMLGSHLIWTQEHRWADIVSGMFYRHDFLHPYLNDVNYYDKPLLSYWLIAGFAWLTGHLSTWAMRLPSALAGLLAVWSIYRIGTGLKNRSFGLLAGWMLLTTYYFVFWARTSSADMLNLGGMLFAVAWYVDKKNQPSLQNYAIFFLILAVTALCKGIFGIVVALLAIFPDFVMKQEWKKHLNARFLLAMIPAAIVYYLPFWASAHMGNSGYHENGLYLVYRENILRYIQPFDHKDPIYTYFIFLPVYLLPWTVFFIPALFSLKNRWKMLSAESKWIVWSVLLLFLFLTISGSRRNYYVLPVVPFAILLTADWILETVKRMQWAGRFAVGFFAILVLNFNVLQPLYYAGGGERVFAANVQAEEERIHPGAAWNVVMLDPESKVRFYLNLSPEVKNLPVMGDRHEQTEQSLQQVWPILHNQQPNQIFITRRRYVPLLQKILPDYIVIEAPATWGERVLKINNLDAPAAFVSVM